MKGKEKIHNHNYKNTKSVERQLLLTSGRDKGFQTISHSASSKGRLLLNGNKVEFHILEFSCTKVI